jgi:hypothetical protein
MGTAKVKSESVWDPHDEGGAVVSHGVPCRRQNGKNVLFFKLLDYPKISIAPAAL